MVKDAYYFSHDSNARQDPKILETMSMYGAEGYGWYWILVEMMREQGDYTLSLKGKYTFNALAMQMQCNPDATEQYVKYCINEFELFESDGESFWSNSLLRRMAMREETSQKRKKAAEARWGKKADTTAIKEDEDTKGMQVHSTSNANGMQGKESKLKKKEIKQQQTTEAPKSIEVIPERKPVVVVDDEFAKLTNFYSENIGPLNKAIGDELGDMCDMVNPELALLALKEAVLANARNKINYTNTILQSWKSQNFETAADVDQSEARRQTQWQHNKVASLFDASPETQERQRLDAEKYKDVVIDTRELPY